jgi:parvulin-like peptidyl-prolyl isomerase
MSNRAPELSPSAFIEVPRPRVRRSMLCFAFGALIGLAIAGYGLFTARGTRSHSVPPEALALVNSRPILRSDFMAQVQSQFAAPFAQSTAEQRRQVLEDMLAEELQVQRGLEIDLPNFDPDVRAAMVAGVQLEITADVMAQQPTGEQLRKYYEANSAKYVSEGILRMRDLLAKTVANARQAAIALRAGTPLEQVVQRYRLEDSGKLMDAGHVDTGEIFEFAAKAKLAPAAYAAAATLHSGQISDPIPASDGIHVIVMIEHRMPVQENYAAAADKLWIDFKNDAQARVKEANVRYLRSRADILLSTDARTLEAKAK